MSQCKDHWCENYGSQTKCNDCKKNDSKQEEPHLQVLLKRRAVKQMELDSQENGKSPNQQQR